MGGLPSKARTTRRKRRAERPCPRTWSGLAAIIPNRPPTAIAEQVCPEAAARLTPARQSYPHTFIVTPLLLRPPFLRRLCPAPRTLTGPCQIKRPAHSPPPPRPAVRRVTLRPTSAQPDTLISALLLAETGAARLKVAAIPWRPLRIRVIATVVAMGAVDAVRGGP